MIAASGASAQTAGAVAGTPVTAAIKSELTAGSVRAKVTMPAGGRTLSAGSTVFAELKVQSHGPAKVSAAEVEIYFEGGEIIKVGGQGKERRRRRPVLSLAVPAPVPGRHPRRGGDGAATSTAKAGARPKAPPRGETRTVKLTGLRRGKTRSVLVELRLGGDSAGTTASNLLRLTLRDATGGGEDSTERSWPVANCAAGYYAALTRIRQTNFKDIRASVRLAAKREASWPGRWLFRPQLRRGRYAYSKRRRRVCVRRRRVFSYARGRYINKCTRYATRRVAARVRAKPAGPDDSKEAAGVLRLASTYVRSRGAASDMSPRTSLGFLLLRVRTDVRNYLIQKPNPALCTGAIFMLDYYFRNSRVIRQRFAKVAKAAQRSRSLAYGRTLALRDALWSAPGGHPAWGGAPLSILRPFQVKRDDPEMPLKLVRAMAGWLLKEEARDAVAGQTDLMQALRTMRRVMTAQNRAVGGDAVWSQANRALSMIEAGVYLARVDKHYGAIRDSVYGSMQAIRDAHKSRCVCSSG